MEKEDALVAGSATLLAPALMIDGDYSTRDAEQSVEEPYGAGVQVHLQLPSAGVAEVHLFGSAACQNPLFFFFA